MIYNWKNDRFGNGCFDGGWAEYRPVADDSWQMPLWAWAGMGAVLAAIIIAQI